MAEKKLKAENMIVTFIRAEAECLAEAEVRDRRQEREAERHAHQDTAYIAEFARKIAACYPNLSSPNRFYARRTCLQNTFR